MTGDDVQSTLTFDDAAMPKSDRNLFVQDAAACGGPQEHNDLRADDRELLKQVVPAMSDIVRAWFAVGRAILHDVGQVNALFVETDLSDRLTQPLSGSAYEWAA